MARRLRLENEALRVRLCEVMTTAGMVDEASVAEAFSPVVAEGTETHGRGTSAAVKKSAAESMVSVPTTNRRRAPTTAEERLKQEVDDGYFDSYSYFDIHRDMIGDTARTDAYRDALEKNPTLIQGKTCSRHRVWDGDFKHVCRQRGRERRRRSRRRQAHRRSRQGKREAQRI